MSDDEVVPVEVQLPQDLLYDIDEFGTTRGYITQGAVVSQALETAED